MSERDNERKNQIYNAKELAGNQTNAAGDGAQKALDDVNEIRRKLEQIRDVSATVDSKGIDEIASEKKVDAAYDTLDNRYSSYDVIDKRYTTSVSPEELAAAERAVREQMLRDERENIRKRQEKEASKVVGKIAEIREREARERAERKLIEREKKKSEAAAAKEKAKKLAEIREKVEIRAEINEEIRSREEEKRAQEVELLGSKITQISHSQDFFVKAIKKRREKELIRLREEEEERRQREEEERQRQIDEELKRAREAEIKRLIEEEEKRRLEYIRQEKERVRLQAEERERAERELAEIRREEQRRLAEQKLEEERLEKKRLEENRLKEQKARAKAERQRIKEEKERERREALLRIKQEEEKAKAEKAAEKAKIKAEKARLKREQLTRASKEKAAAKKQREERDFLIAQQRAIQKEKRAKEEKEKKERRKAEARKKNAERKARNKAKKGGGIVNAYGVQVETDIKHVPTFSWGTLLGLEKKKEIKEAKSKEKKEQLHIENERIKTAARQEARKLAEGNIQKFKESKVGRSMTAFFEFCENKKKGLLIAFAAVLMLAIGAAGVLNYFTAYEYSYNGAKLGYVKEKDDVLQITEMVQNALSEEKNINVVIDAREDFSFDRQFMFDKDVLIDTADDVLRRLTYMGDLNVRAYGIYIDGKKVGAVENKNAAVNVMETILDRYTSDKEGSEVESFSFVENVVFKTSNTDLRDVLSEEQMVEKLCTSGEKTSVYTVVKGDTLANIARDHSLTEEDIINDNNNVNPEKLEVGSTLVIKETAPLMQMKITEVRSYEKKTDYATIKQKDKDVYEGFTEVAREGKKGLSEITDRTISVNGEVVETINLKNDVKKKPVDKIVKVGTKERPPTIGTGTYIWPAYSGTYSVTSEFKWRWGRQHQGIDMGCPTGTDVLASDGGTVTYAGYMGGYGNLVIIDHGDGIETYYGHNSALIVRVGDKVFQGQHIAEAGNTGRSFGSHIHFGVKDHGTFYNPRNYLP